MRYTFLMLVLLMLLSACGPDGRPGILGKLRIDSLRTAQEEPPSPQRPDTTTFEQAFGQFLSALQSADTAALNKFVDAEQGLWLIEQPGAIPSYSHFKNIQEVERSYLQRPFTSINEEIKECQPTHRDVFPEFDCADMDQGATGFAEDGCFYTFSTAGFQETEMWKYAELKEEQERQVQAQQKQVEATVLHTGTSYQFHFGYRNGRWLLLFADLRTPCSA